ncbi:radical SAM protein [Lagierella sp.]|uniref:radical SAM protein n=1 Tax=Lagierella sp. TaxID=2849657 RepID=UPI002606E329|nr:radical SAM protein [Lagierella sp.]
MEEKFLITKQIGEREILFDAKNMLLFDTTLGFDEEQYLNIIQSLNFPEENKKDSASKIVLNISNACNYKCVYCYANHGNYGKENAFMDIDTLNKIVDDLLNKGIKNIGTIELFGGEATLNPKLLDIVEIIDESFNVNQFLLTTNGSGSMDLVKKLSNYPMRYYISLDGPKEVNDMLRGNGSYDAAMRFISWLNDFKSDYSVSVTYTKVHEDLGIDYQDLYEFAKNNNFSIEINTVISNNKNIEINRRITKKQLISEIDRTLDILANGEKNINLDPYVIRILKGLFLSKRSQFFCDDLQTNITIHYDYDGSLYNCFKLWSDHRFKLENISSEHEVLNLYNQKENFNQCRTCWARYLCELCIADTFLGEENFPFLDDCCVKKERFEITLEKILVRLENGDIDRIKSNFINYIV